MGGRPESTTRERGKQVVFRVLRAAAVARVVAQFGLGPSRVGPQTSRPLGASFLISEYALKYRAKSEAVLCNFEPRLFDA